MSSANDFKEHAGKKEIDLDDLELAKQQRMSVSFVQALPREMLLSMARERNRRPLPPIPNRAGVQLPLDAQTLTAPTYQIATESESLELASTIISSTTLSSSTSLSSSTTPSSSAQLKSSSSNTSTNDGIAAMDSRADED